MTEAEEKGHYDFIDLVKGIGILLVVWGHTMTPRSVYLYSFHMPLFFFVSGYLHRDRPARSFLAGKVRRLYLPYLVFSALSWLFYLAVLYLRGKHALLPAHIGRLLSLVDGTARNGGNDSIWFLTCLLVTSTLFWAIHRLKKPLWAWLFVAAASVAGYVMGLYDLALPFKIDVALSGLVFYHFGYETKRRNVLCFTERLRLPEFFALVGIAEGVHLITAFHNVRVSGISKVAMISNNLGDYFLFYISAFTGIAALIAVGYRLRRLKVLNYLGVNSLVILAYHKPLLYLLRLVSGGAINDGSRLSGLFAAGIAVALILPLVRVGPKYAPWLVGLPPGRPSPGPGQAATGG